MFSACAERESWWGSFSAWPDRLCSARTRGRQWVVQRL